MIRRVDVSSGRVTFLAGKTSGAVGDTNNKGYSDGQGTSAAFWQPVGIAMDSAGSFAIIVRGGGGGGGGGGLLKVRIRYTPTHPHSIPPKTDWQNHIIRRLNVSSGLVKTIAGSIAGTIGLNNYGLLDGLGTEAKFKTPEGVAMDAAGSVAVIVRAK